MSKRILVALSLLVMPAIFLAFPLEVSAQWTGTNPIYELSGKVGIKTSNPDALLDIYQSGSTPTNLLKLYGPDSSKIIFNTPSGGLFQTSSSMVFRITNPTNIYGGPNLIAFQYSDGIYIMSVKANGRVGIMTNTPTSELTVNGTITTKQIIVTTAIQPDYVFSDTYLLRPLSSVEKFIEENKHLPDVPAASEISSNGINVGEYQTVLLKKIEELTLYTIEQEKNINELRAQVNTLMDK